MYLYFSVPGNIGKRHLYHQVDVELVAPADTAYGLHLSQYIVRGMARRRYEKREIRRSGGEPEQFTWKKKVKSHRNGHEPIEVVALAPYRRWMDDGVLVVVHEWRQTRPKKPMVVLEPLVFYPGRR